MVGQMRVHWNVCLFVGECVRERVCVLVRKREYLRASVRKDETESFLVCVCVCVSERE